jgi:crotonobetainyl-CoA:carnitine CoA-transferase CaiB-like acyl-CoA transferase
VIISVGNNAQFERLCIDALERPDLAADDRYKTNLGRGQHRAHLLPELYKEIGSRKRDHLIAAMTKAGIPCGEVLGLHEALTSPRATEGGLVTQQPHPVAGSTHVLAPPYRMDGERLPVRMAPPVLGAHKDEVLREWLG